MACLFDLLDKHDIQFNYDFPDWITAKYLYDIKKKMDSDAVFRYNVLYLLISEHIDETSCGHLGKFFDSWVYGYDTMK